MRNILMLFLIACPCSIYAQDGVVDGLRKDTVVVDGLRKDIRAALDSKETRELLKKIPELNEYLKATNDYLKVTGVVANVPEDAFAILKMTPSAKPVPAIDPVRDLVKHQTKEIIRLNRLINELDNRIKKLEETRLPLGDRQ